jgi:hypothetical protein
MGLLQDEKACMVECLFVGGMEGSIGCLLLESRVMEWEQNAVRLRLP